MPAPSLLSPPPWRRFLRGVLWLCLTLLCVLCGVWGVLALLAHAPSGHQVAQALALVWGFAWLIVWGWGLLQRRMLFVVACGAVLMLCIGMWWSTIRPRADLDWAADVARLVEVEADAADPAIVQLRNVRNFDWRSESDFTPRWETRRYDLNQLDSVDVALSYWMGPAIAHTLVSFGFRDGQHVVFSIEIRKESHETFDALAGFFKQYEMALVAADERDILAVRTNVRGEDIRMFRIHMPQAAMRELFMAYARQASLLAYAPRFYHTLTANCTTIVWQLARRIGQELPLDWRLLASGYLPEYLRDAGALDSLQPLELLRKSGNITALAQQWRPPEQAGDIEASIDFSRHIRQHM